MAIVSSLFICYIYIYIYIPIYIYIYIYNHTPPKKAHHSEIFIRAIHLKCSNIENKVISSPICDELIWERVLMLFIASKLSKFLMY